MNDRLMIAAMAMQGMYTNERYNSISFADTANEALKQADALLAAAGEGDNQERTQDNFGLWVQRALDAESKLAACERERDALNAEVWVHHPAVRAEYEAEIAALKRRLEPLTREEGGGVNNPTIYGSRPLAWDEITAIVADADRIRARRQP